MEHLIEIPAIKWKDGKYSEVIEKTVTDRHAYLFIDCLPPRKFAVYPSDLKDFAIGYCVGEGLIKTTDDIKSIKIDDVNIFVETSYQHTPEEDLDLSENNKTCPSPSKLHEYGGVQSDSAGGIRTELKTITPVESDLKVNATEIVKDLEILKENAEIWRDTGSVHVAQLVYKDKRIIREDVSRHVAVDKVIGAALIAGYDFSQCYITYSGRMPADMLAKVVRVGIPIIASNAAPAGSGYNLAKKGNITMIGFVRGNRFNLYTAPERVNLNK